MLLTGFGFLQESFIPGFGDDGRYQNLKNSVAKGLIYGPDQAGYTYPNAACALCRVLLPHMLANISPWSEDPWLQWALFGKPRPDIYERGSEPGYFVSFSFYVF